MNFGSPVKETILLRDDDEAICRFLRTLLTLHGYQVLEAHDGKRALEVAETHDGPIHLLLSDVMMPELDGPSLAEQLKVVRPDVRVIFISAFSDGLVELLNGCPLVQKPFAGSALLKTVGDSLALPPHPLRRRV